MNEVQTHIQSLLEHACAAGRERGIQVAAYHHGRLIVNAWAGMADVNTGEPVTADTLFPVFSVTKGVTATLIHQLVERGHLDYTTPVAEIWPEFAANGKALITVEHVLRHQAGLPKLPAGLDFATCSDWNRICAIIAGLPVQWAPGTRHEYHGLTYGWILGEVAQRITGRPFTQLVQAEIGAPLGLTTLHVGLPADCTATVAWLESPEVPPPVDDGTPQVIPVGLQPLHVWMNRREARVACAPAANGIMNAHAIARHYAALLPGGVDGVELLPALRIATATTLLPPAAQSSEADLMPHGAMGYSVGGPGATIGASPAVFGHGGYGGATGFADRAHHLAVGLTHNLLRLDDAAPEILDELRQAVSQA